LSGFSRSSVTQGSVDGTVKSVWFQQVFGLLSVQYIGLKSVWFQQVFDLLRVQ
jgi:hypothetical protein